MTHHRRLVLAQQIAHDGILAELARAEVGPLLDLAEVDRDEIRHMVRYIAHSTRHMQFTERLERLTFGNIYLECSSMSREAGES